MLHSPALADDPPMTPENPLPAQLGTVYLVGAGPGAADLLTVRAARLICAAHTVVRDHLIGDDILAMIPPDAEQIYVGKQAGRHTLAQEDINQLLVKLALEGRDVVRLKGGDPFIFGRGGEEILDLTAAGVPFEVVPGITAAGGAAAYAGIPLTHRDLARACTFATGHFHDGSCDLDWTSLARPDQTVVIYMGVGAVAVIAEQLTAHGLPPDTPVAVVRHATLPHQTTVVGTLQSITQAVKTEGIRPPALLIIGEVVRLRERLNWFGR